MRRSKVFIGNSHTELGELICNRLGVEPAPCTLKKFSNGETSVEIGVSVRDEDVYIVQSGSPSVNDHLMELLILISGCRTGSAHKITAVIPSYPYSKQSKMKKHRGAITARMIANLLTMAGADHVITMDLHANQMQGFFTVPVDNLHAGPTLAQWIRHNVPDYKDAVVVSKNPGGTKRVTALADALKINFAMIQTDRRRNHKPYSSMLNLAQAPIFSVASPRKKGARGAPPTVLPAPGSPLNGTARRASMKLQDGPNTTHGTVPSRRKSSNTRKPSQVGGRRPSLNPGEEGEDDVFDDDDDEGVHIVTAHGVQTARVVQGHVVGDDYLEEESESEAQSEAESRPRLQHTDSSVDLKHALGGSVDAEGSDDDDEEFKREKLITLVGDVRGRTAIIVDDMIDRHGSFVAAAEHCRLNCGAKRVVVIATHGIFNDDCLEQLQACPCIDSVVVTNTYPIPVERRIAATKLVVIDVSAIFAECMRRNHHGESISALFEQMTM